jgi:hypothetical protein
MLKLLLISATEDTPYVLLDQQNETFEITGRSFPEDASKFYSPVISWIEEYVKDPCKKTRFRFNLEYFNSTSLKQLLEILLRLEQATVAGNEVKIIWRYGLNDDLMAAKGQEIQNLVNLPFELMPE